MLVFGGGGKWYHSFWGVWAYFRVPKMAVSSQFWGSMAADDVGCFSKLEELNKNLGGGFKHFLFSPLLGEMIQCDYIIFLKWVETTNYFFFLNPKNWNGANLGGKMWWKLTFNPMKTNMTGWKIHHEWRCISYWTMGIFHLVMLVFRGVPQWNGLISWGIFHPKILRTRIEMGRILVGRCAGSLGPTTNDWMWPKRLRSKILSPKILGDHSLLSNLVMENLVILLMEEILHHLV